MFESVTVREFMGGFVTSELLQLYKDSLKWQNPTLAVVTQQELFRRGRREDVKSIITNFLKKNKLQADTVFARMLSAGFTSEENDLFFYSLKDCIDNIKVPISLTVLQKRIEEAKLEEQELFEEQEKEEVEEPEDRVYPVYICKTGKRFDLPLMASSKMKINLYS